MIKSAVAMAIACSLSTSIIEVESCYGSSTSSHIQLTSTTE